MSPRIMCHHRSVSEEDREFMRGKVDRLKKFYERIHEVSVILGAEKHTQQAEILLWGPRLNLRVEGEADDIRTAFELAINKAERWLRKTKEKMYGDKMHRRRNVTIRRFGPEEVVSAFVEEEETPKETGALAIPVERMEPRHMTLQEAVELMKAQKNLLVFVNSQTHEVNILHRNKDDQVELIQLSESELREAHEDEGIAL